MNKRILKETASGILVNVLFISLFIFGAAACVGGAALLDMMMR